jgi:hypothetical protein
MGHVLIGSFIGIIIGAFLGSLVENPDVRNRLVIVTAAGCGGIIGAVAGAVSALPNARPLPPWFLWLVLGLVVFVIILGALLWAFRLGSKPGRPVEAVPQEQRGQDGPGLKNP